MPNCALKPPLYSNFVLPWQCEIMKYSSITFELVRDFEIWKIVLCNKGFTKFQLNLPYLGYNTVLRTLEIRHYGPVHEVSKTGL